MMCTKENNSTPNYSRGDNYYLLGFDSYLKSTCAMSSRLPPESWPFHYPRVQHNMCLPTTLQWYGLLYKQSRD